jgi:hypothetical protein
VFACFEVASPCSWLEIVDRENQVDRRADPVAYLLRMEGSVVADTGVDWAE